MSTEYKDLMAEIVAFEQKIIAIKDQMIAMKRQAIKELHPPEYKWVPTVVIVESQKGFNNIPAGTQVLMFEGQISNRQIYDNHVDIFGDLDHEPIAKLTSRRYWRKNTVLIAQGIGWSYLVNHEIVNDEEWEQMMAGQPIPDRLLSI